MLCFNKKGWIGYEKSRISFMCVCDGNDCSG